MLRSNLSLVSLALLCFLLIVVGTSKSGHRDLTEVRFGDDNSSGLPYVVALRPGASFKEAELGVSNTSPGPVFNIRNGNTDRSMCVFGQFNFEIGYHGELRENDTAGYHLPANGTAQIGHLAGEHMNDFDGRIWARHGCDTNCGNCAGLEEDAANTLTYDPRSSRHGEPLSPDVHSLVEFSYVDGTLWENLSNVDGYTMSIDITVPETECTPKICMVSRQRLKDKCPKANYWSDNGVEGCRSDCKRTNSDFHCCEGAWADRGTCEPSSHFLADICDQAYAHPHHDEGNVDRCKGARFINIEFGAVVREPVLEMWSFASSCP